MRTSRILWLAFAMAAFTGCGGGSNSASTEGTAPPPPQSTPDSGCTGSCANAQTFLSAADVQTAIAQAAAEAQAQAKPAVIAVVDRVGNVLAVYRMTGAPDTMTITSGRDVVGGLEGLAVPSELAAIAKAVTGAYLSSEGNAFSTRTASQIVQEHFNPGVRGTPAGPLFGVQFSQLPCSDLATHFTTGTGAGPHNSPLGLSADPGGFPLYKNGTPVGGIGIAADGVYGLDPDVMDKDRNADELIAKGENDIGINYLRVSIGASDLGSTVYSYDDMPRGQEDRLLTKFNLAAGDREVLDILQEILKINPNIKIMGSPWSAPAWMKTNEDAEAGSLRKDCYDVYAAYLVKYLEEMKKRGISVNAITVSTFAFLNCSTAPSNCGFSLA